MTEISERDIRRICHLYYKEKKKQEEISGIIGVSRFRICRILKEAWKDNIISVVINDPWVDLTQVETAIVKKFQIQLAIVVQNNEFGGEPPEAQVAKAGADYLRKVVGLHNIVGVAWGQTLYQLVSQLKPIKCNGLTLVQLAGTLGTIEGTDNNMLTVMFGQKLGVSSRLIPAPVIVQSQKIKDTILKEKKIQETLTIARKASLAIFGVGLANVQGLLWKLGFLNETDASELRKARAVGAICGRFFDTNGRQCWHKLDNRTIGLDLDEIKRIKQKVGVAVGMEKVKAICGALKGGLIDVLITDELTAKELLKEE